MEVNVSVKNNSKVNSSFRSKLTAKLKLVSAVKGANHQLTYKQPHFRRNREYHDILIFIKRFLIREYTLIKRWVFYSVKTKQSMPTTS